jgi:branched-chain amino acid transport system ATP-binding protein
MGILMVEQNARKALVYAQRGYVLELGRVALQGPAVELRRHPRVLEAYIGG